MRPANSPTAVVVINDEADYFFGVANGAAGFGAAAAGFAAFPFNIVAPAPPALRVAKIESDIEVSINTIADIVVAFESSVAEPRGPKAV